MLQSIKVDIVYYSIGSDFEMEFNLCGCCRMRLLTDKVQGQSDFSKSLSRAVKRSRVIMLCGPLFGEKGLINTVSKVTGINTEKLDKTAYDLNTDSDIDILKGSTALVSDDGVFGGCIIESNTQSIIILSESKSLRKNIMKQLIYPYITKLSIMPDLPTDTQDVEVNETNTDAVNDEENNAVDAEQSEFADAAEIVADTHEETVDVSDTANDDDVKPDPSDDFVIDISNVDTVKNADQLKNPADSLNDALIIDINDDSDDLSVEEKNHKYYLFDDENDDVNVNSPVLSIAIKIIVAFIILIAVLIIYFAVAKPLILQQNVFSYLKNIFSSNAFIDPLNIF
ncbi:MAG: hypothetical protein J5766_04955 [Clostridia bacterium]|nr:hypothetical protein [Clostridia bacterium]